MEAHALQDGPAGGHRVDLEVPEAPVAGQHGAVADEGAEDPAAAPRGSVPPPQMLAKSVPSWNSTRPAETASSPAQATTASIGRGWSVSAVRTASTTDGCVVPGPKTSSCTRSIVATPAASSTAPSARRPGRPPAGPGRRSRPPGVSRPARAAARPPRAGRGGPRGRRGSRASTRRSRWPRAISAAITSSASASVRSLHTTVDQEPSVPTVRVTRSSISTRMPGPATGRRRICSSKAVSAARRSTAASEHPASAGANDLSDCGEAQNQRGSGPLRFNGRPGSGGGLRQLRGGPSCRRSSCGPA